MRAYLTDDGHIFPHNLPGEKTALVFWSDQIEELQSEYEEAMSLSPGAAEEWVKGLANRSKKAMSCVNNWEKWDSESGVHLMRTSPELGSLYIEGDRTSGFHSDPRSPVALREPSVSKAQPSPGGSRLSATSAVESSPPNQTPSDQQQQVMEHTEKTLAYPIAEMSPQPSHLIDERAEQTESSDSTSSAGGNHGQPRPPGVPKRTMQEVAAVRHNRRLEIERRALLLDPPIIANDLARMPSFQAALQVTAPLDDMAWELLKPRLLDQRVELVSKEKASAEKVLGLGAQQVAAREQVASPLKATQPVTDEDWDNIQGPVRARIAEFAEEIIRVKWDNGDKVGKKNSPRFAAEVLVYVRKKFYAEVAKKAAVATSAGLRPIEDPPEGPWTQKLTLENMKWVFDTQIKFHTEPLRPDLFLCNGCEGNSRHYGLESVIQHYAAKHTTALSNGNVVVYWRAEWPEVSPFRPDGKPSQLSTTTTTATTTSAGYQPYSAGSYSTGIPGLSVAGYPAQGYGVPPPAQASLPFSSHPLDPTAPAFSAPATQSYPIQDAGYPSYPSYPPVPMYGATAYYQPAPSAYGGLPNPMPYEHMYGAQPEPQAVYTHQPPVDPSVKYNLRLETMMKVSREAWNLIQGVGDLPSSVKACVVVHRIAKTFQDGFSEAAPLGMFIDGLSNQKDMRLIRRTPGLACKTCATGHNVFERTDFSLPQLCNHFQKAHVEDRQSQGLSPLDWRIDMIMLPELPVLRGLKKVLADVPPAYALVEDALPWAFDEQPEYPSIHQQHTRATPTDSPAGGARLGLDHDPAAQPDQFDAQQKKPEVPRANAKSPATQVCPTHDDNHQDGEEVPGHRVESHSPSYSPEPPNVVPVLRPAREVYKRERFDGRFNTMPREQARRPEGDVRHRSSRDCPMPRVRDHGVPDYRDVESPRYVTKYPRHERRSSMRAEEETHQISQTSRSYPHESLASRPADHGYDIHYAREPREPRYQREVDEVIYLDSSGREVRRAFRPVEARARDVRVFYQDDFAPDMHSRPRSPGYSNYVPRSYYEEDARPYEPHGYQHEPGHVIRRVYHDDPRPSRTPMEATELVKVHDPRGDYYIRHPIHREEREYYDYDREIGPRDLGAHMPYGPVGDHSRGSREHETGRSASRAEDQQRNIKVEHGEYDPRYPAAERSRESQAPSSRH